MKIKRLLSLGIAVVLAIMTTACGTSGTDSTPAKATNSAEVAQSETGTGETGTDAFAGLPDELDIERMWPLYRRCIATWIFPNR